MKKPIRKSRLFLSGYLDRAQVLIQLHLQIMPFQSFHVIGHSKICWVKCIFSLSRFILSSNTSREMPYIIYRGQDQTRNNSIVPIFIFGNHREIRGITVLDLLSVNVFSFYTNSYNHGCFSCIIHRGFQMNQFTHFNRI